MSVIFAHGYMIIQFVQSGYMPLFDSLTGVLSPTAIQVIDVPLQFIPKLVAAIIIVIIGWIIAYLVERAFVSIFNALSFFDDALKNLGVEDITRRAGMQVNLW